MNIKNVTINNYNFAFVGEYKSSRYGFTHACTLFINEQNRSAASVHYLNRTWETYRFQTVYRLAIHKLISDLVSRLEREYKELHGYKRMTAQRRADFNASIADHETLAAYRAALAQL